MTRKDSKPTSRRDLLKGALAAGLVAGAPRAYSVPMLTNRPFVTILRFPDLVRAFGPDNAEIVLEKLNGGVWEGGGVEIGAHVEHDFSRLTLKGKPVVSRVQLRWHGDLGQETRYMGDHWERSYGDLEWRGESAGRTMPWYFMAFDGKRTDAYGVRTGPNAMCFWNADSQGVSLWADVRSGGVPVELGDRVLDVADIICREGEPNESPFAATRAFCGQMCRKARLPAQPVYGTNDWNYAYGHSSAELIAGVSGLISELSPNGSNRPYSVIDEGWAQGPYQNNFGHGPWFGNPNFGDMAAFGDRLKGLGVRPGLWFRPLTPLSDSPANWRLQRDTDLLDPTIPEVLDHVYSHIRRFVGWGYEMIKHDYTTYDIFGRWGMQMGPSPTKEGWRLHDSSKTNAEVITDLYRTIRRAAGEAHVIGCNTVGHLSPGYHDIMRTGDDTSGRSWNRNRRMGVNTLAFRAPQHRLFYEVDPDIVAITKAVPWNLVEQWLSLVSRSGTALFVAVEPGIIEARHRDALKTAFDIASKEQTVGEPLDWMATDCPRRWRLRGKPAEFAWMGAEGAWPFSD